MAVDPDTQLHEIDSISGDPNVNSLTPPCEYSENNSVQGSTEHNQSNQSDDYDDAITSLKSIRLSNHNGHIIA